MDYVISGFDVFGLILVDFKVFESINTKKRPKTAKNG